MSSQPLLPLLLLLVSLALFPFLLLVVLLVALLLLLLLLVLLLLLLMSVALELRLGVLEPTAGALGGQLRRGHMLLESMRLHRRLHRRLHAALPTRRRLSCRHLGRLLLRGGCLDGGGLRDARGLLGELRIGDGRVVHQRGRHYRLLRGRLDRRSLLGISRCRLGRRFGCEEQLHLGVSLRLGPDEGRNQTSSEEQSDVIRGAIRRNQTSSEEQSDVVRGAMRRNQTSLEEQSDVSEEPWRRGPGELKDAARQLRLRSPEHRIVAIGFGARSCAGNGA